MNLQPIRPTWPAPPQVRAAVSTRSGGYSTGPFASLNLGAHVDDDPDAVAANRRALRQCLKLPAEPVWLDQVHGNRVLRIDANPPDLQADAAATHTPGVVAAILTADCLPVLLCDRKGTRVAAVHAGWRGLAADVIEAGVAALDVPGESVLAWLGPAIGPDAFEVGDEVRATFADRNPEDATAFRRNDRGRWQADLYALARARLARAGVSQIHGGEFCTFSDVAHFFSYRRDGPCGRMASLIWLAP